MSQRIVIRGRYPEPEGGRAPALWDGTHSTVTGLALGGNIMPGIVRRMFYGGPFRRLLKEAKLNIHASGEFELLLEVNDNMEGVDVGVVDANEWDALWAWEPER